MKRPYAQLGALGLFLLTSNAHALGLGEIVLHSRIGEPIRAEVPLLGESTGLENDCFSVQPPAGADLPTLPTARLRVAESAQGRRHLIITGQTPVNEPIFMLGIRVQCGADVERSYTLIPSAPLPVLVATPTDNTGAGMSNGVSANPVRRRMAANFMSWPTRPGESLASIAEDEEPDDIVARRRLLEAMQKANPDIAPDRSLPPGTPVRIPRMDEPAPTRPVPLYESTPTPPPPARRPAQAPSTPKPVATKPRPAPPPAPAPPPPAPAQPATKGGDRLVLESAPASLSQGEATLEALETLQNMETRMSRLESTLGLLNSEVEKLNAALEATAKLLAAQNQMQIAQITAPPPAATLAPSQKQWLELLLSALAGGGIAGVLVYFLDPKRRRKPADTLDL